MRWSRDGWRFALLALLAAAPLAANGPATASERRRPPGLFERDWVLMNWALKFYDSDRDILLEPGEAAAAAARVPQDRRRR